MDNLINENIDKDITISEKAEQSVLGCILMDNDAIIEISGLINADDFYFDAHKLIYTAMLELFKESVPIEFLTICEKLRTITDLENVGGYAYIATLPSITDYSQNIIYYAKIVKEKSKLRQVIASSNKIIRYANSGKSINEVLEVAEKTIFNISQENTKKDLVGIQSVLTQTCNEIEKNYKNKGKMTGLDTGFIDLNAMTNGLQKSDLIIIGARPAVGKTAFALNLAKNCAKSGAKVAIFSLEMSDTQLSQRLVASESKVEMGKIKNGDLNVEDWEKLTNAMSNLSKYQIHINDTAGITLLEIRSQCRKLKMLSGLDMIVIDYLQLMDSESNVESRQLFISQVSRGLKILAKELNCTIIALSQLSRDAEKKGNRKPMLSDLRESGSIEQDADMVMFLHRDAADEKDPMSENIVHLIIAKHRSGSTGEIDLAWFGKYQLFLSLEKSI